MKPLIESDLKKAKRRFIRFFEFLDQQEAKKEKDGFFYYSPEENRVEYDFDSDPEKPEKVTKKVFSRSGNISQVAEFYSAEDLLVELSAMVEQRGGAKIEAQTLDDSTLDLEQLNMSFLEENSATDRVIAEESSLSKEKQLELNKKLFDAASKKNTTLQEIEELYEQGAQVNASFPDSRDKRWSQSALNKAIECGNYEVAEFLLQKHADPNAQKNLSFAVLNPLQLAVLAGDTKFVKLLLDNNADHSQKGRLDIDPLEFMLLGYCEEDSEEKKDGVKACLDLFKQKGADIKQTAENLIKEGILNEKEVADLQKLVTPYLEKEIGSNSLQEDPSLKSIITTLGTHLTENPNNTKGAPTTPLKTKPTPENSR